MVTKLAQKLSKSLSYISRRIRLVELPQDILRVNRRWFQYAVIYSRFSKEVRHAQYEWDYHP